MVKFVKKILILIVRNQKIPRILTAIYALHKNDDGSNNNIGVLESVIYIM